MGIRLKIMLGFIILASMLFLSGAISIYEITRLGHSMKGLIDDNYRSINYSKSMLTELDEQDIAILHYIGQGKSDWKDHFFEAQLRFEASLDSSRSNLTLPNEIAIVDSIVILYDLYLQKAEFVFAQQDYSLNDYINGLHLTSVRLSKYVHKLMSVNQEALYDSTSRLEGSAQRATMPGLIVIITSLLFTLVFTFFVNHFFVSPIIRLTRGINDYLRFRKPFDVALETRDELSSLKEAIVNLISFAKIGRK